MLVDNTRNDVTPDTIEKAKLICKELSEKLGATDLAIDSVDKEICVVEVTCKFTPKNSSNKRLRVIVTNYPSKKALELSVWEWHKTFMYNQDVADVADVISYAKYTRYE